MKINKDYTKIIPRKFFGVDYKDDVPDLLKTVVGQQIRKRQGLYLWGDTGTGKTHIACAIAKQILERNIPVKFFNVAEMLEDMRESFYGDIEDEIKESAFREIMGFEGVLILDDVGAEKASDWTRERLFLIINKKYEEEYPIIFTSNCSLETLQDRLGDRITSRISEMTENFKITGEDKRNSIKLNLDSYAS